MLSFFSSLQNLLNINEDIISTMSQIHYLIE